jgi:hypothetical protein
MVLSGGPLIGATDTAQGDAQYDYANNLMIGPYDPSGYNYEVILEEVQYMRKVNRTFDDNVLFTRPRKLMKPPPHLHDSILR